MLFVLDDSLFTETADTMAIVALLHIASSSERHVVLVGNDQSKNYNKWTAKLEASLQQNVSTLLDVFVRSAAPGRIAKTITVRHFAPDEQTELAKFSEVNITHATKLATRAFHVYVENSRNDKRFLLAACTEAQRVRLNRLIASNALQFVHGGGITELKMQIEQDYRDGRLIADFTWVMFDSDALVVGNPSGQSINLKETCTRLGIKSAQLQYRAIENYAPKESLRNWAYSGPKSNQAFKQRTKNFVTYVALPQPLARHYNMKKGIAADRGRADYPARDAIYDKLNPVAISDLEHGFGSNVSDVFNWGLDESALKTEGSWQELQTMITELESLL